MGNSQDMRRLEKQRSELAGGAVLLDRIYVCDEDAIRHVAKLAKIAFSKRDYDGKVLI